ncbi:MAG: TolC family protein, partial [Aureliella sp.]
SLADFEQMALVGNPTLAQAAAQVEAVRGRALQAGLYPNPTVGYTGQQIGSEGRAGQQGFYVTQMLVTGGRLQLNRAKFAQEATEMQWQALAHQYRVLNSVRMHFYRVLALERLIAVQGEVAHRAEDAAKVTEKQVDEENAERADLLEAELAAKKAQNERDDIRARWLQSWRELAALVGQPNLQPASLQGTLEECECELEWQESLASILADSPELRIAQAHLRRQQYALKREQVETIPNVQLQGGSQYDFASDKVQAQLQVGVRLPISDKNQGNIRAAQSQLAHAQAEIARVQMSLTQRLATAFGQYQSDRSDARQYREELLPQAREIYELRLESFRKGKGEWSNVKEAQKNYAETGRQYVETLYRLKQEEVAITGLLLVDGLGQPEPAPSQNEPQRKDEQQRLQEELQQSLIGQGGSDLLNELGRQGQRQ